MNDTPNSNRTHIAIFGRRIQIELILQYLEEEMQVNLVL